MKSRKGILFITLLMLLVVVTGCGKEYMNLQGRVVDKKTGEKIAGAQVKIAGKRVRTNQDGYFQVRELPVSELVDQRARTLKTSASGYKNFQEVLALKEGNQRVKIELARKYMKLSGRVIDRFKGSPMAGIKVEVGNRIVETDANGYFSLAQIPRLAEEKIVKVAAPAYKTYAQPVKINSQTKDLTIKLASRQETKFFFSSNQRGSQDIYLSDIYGAELERLTDSKAAEWAPEWSKTREELLYLSNQGGSPNLYLMRADGSAQRQLTSTNALKEDPIWLDRERIIYSSQRDGDYDLYIMEVDGSRWERLTDNNYYDGEAAYSAKHNAIAYIAESTGTKKLHLMKLDSGVKIVLNKSGGRDRSPRWSSNENKIIFANLQNGNSTLNEININGSALTEIAQVDEEIRDYALWDQDGRLILYATQSQDIKLLTPSGLIRDVLVRPEVKTTGPNWKE